jgi:hypothetical protein
MMQVAIFDYNQRHAAAAKVVDLRNREKGCFFLQIVKEPTAEPAAAVILPEA